VEQKRIWGNLTTFHMQQGFFIIDYTWLRELMSGHHYEFQNGPNSLFSPLLYVSFHIESS